MKLLSFVEIPLFHYFKLQHDKNEIQLLPIFSSYVMPFLEGQIIDKKTKKKLCTQVKDEIIDHLE